MMNQPLVTVIAIAYNHAEYIVASLQSVLTQDYEHIQLIVADDASTDQSVEVIKSVIGTRADITFIENKNNRGNCATFNQALKLAKGKYIIDLALDDLLMQGRIRQQVACLERLGEEYALCFSDASYIDEKSRWVKNHYMRDTRGRLQDRVPQGNVFAEVVSRYFICPPTTMFTRTALLEAGGYDENLAYEDFDIWVRLSRKYKFAYLDEVLSAKRIVRGSLSTRFKHSAYPEMAESTLKVCRKAAWLARSAEEYDAVYQRVQYEMREALRGGHGHVVQAYADLLKGLARHSTWTKFLAVLGKLT